MVSESCSKIGRLPTRKAQAIPPACLRSGSVSLALAVALAMALLSLTGFSLCHAQVVLQWTGDNQVDPQDGTASTIGGSGTWSYTSTNWLESIPPPPQLALSWEDATAADPAGTPSAEFGGNINGLTQYTVTVSNDTAAPSEQLTFHTLRFVDNGYTLVADSSGGGFTASSTLRIAATEDVAVNILTEINGDQGLTINPEPTDKGRVILLGDSSYHGDTEIANGSLRLSAQQAASLGSYTVQDGASLELDGTTGAIQIDNTITLHGGALLAAISGSITTDDVLASAENNPTDTLRFRAVEAGSRLNINSKSGQPIAGNFVVDGSGEIIFNSPLQGSLNSQTSVLERTNNAGQTQTQYGAVVLNAANNQLTEIRLGGGSSAAAGLGLGRDDATTTGDQIIIATDTDATIYADTLNVGDDSSEPRTINADITFERDSAATASSLALGNSDNTRDLTLKGNLYLNNKGFQREISIGRTSNSATIVTANGAVESEGGFALTGGRLVLDPQADNSNFIEGSISLRDNAILQLKQGTETSLGTNAVSLEMLDEDSQLILGQAIRRDESNNAVFDEFYDEEQQTFSLYGLKSQSTGLPVINLGQNNQLRLDAFGEPLEVDFSGQIIDQVGDVKALINSNTLSEEELEFAIAYIGQLTGSSITLRSDNAADKLNLQNIGTQSGLESSWHGYLLVEGSNSPELITNVESLPDPHPTLGADVGQFAPINLRNGDQITPVSGGIYANLDPGLEPLQVTLAQSSDSAGFFGQFLGSNINVTITGEEVAADERVVTFFSHNEVNRYDVQSGTLEGRPEHLGGNMTVRRNAALTFRLESATEHNYSELLSLEDDARLSVQTVNRDENEAIGTLNLLLPAASSGETLGNATLAVEDASLRIINNPSDPMDTSGLSISIADHGILSSPNLRVENIDNSGILAPGIFGGSGVERFGTIQTVAFNNNQQGDLLESDPTIQLQFGTGATPTLRDQLFITGNSNTESILNLSDGGGSLDLEFLDVEPGTETAVGTLNADGSFSPRLTYETGDYLSLIEVDNINGDFSEFNAVLKNQANEVLEIDIKQNLILIYPQDIDDIIAQGQADLIPGIENQESLLLLITPESLVPRATDNQQEDLLGALDVLISDELSDDRRLTESLYLSLLLTPPDEFAEIMVTVERDTIPAVAPRTGFEQIAFEQSDALSRRLSLYMEQLRSAQTRERQEKYAFFAWGEGASATFSLDDVDSDYRSGGFTVGVDWSNNPNFYLGGFMQYEDANLSMARSEIEARTVRGGLFFTRQWDKNYLELLYARGNISYDYTRYSTLFGNFLADPTGKQYLFSAVAGRRLEAGNWLVLRPHAGLIISALEVGEFREFKQIPGLDLSLLYPKTNSTSQKSRLGMDFVSNELPLRQIRTRALLRLAWEHEFSSNRPSQLAFLAQNPGADLYLLTQNSPADAFIFDAQVQALLPPFTTLYMGYGGELSGETSSININTGGRLAF